MSSQSVIERIFRVQRISALAGVVINYKRWSVINSNCNWIAFMPSLWNIHPPVPVADSLWWGVLVTWIISPWATENLRVESTYMCVFLPVFAGVAWRECRAWLRANPEKATREKEKERGLRECTRRIDSGWIPFRPHECMSCKIYFSYWRLLWTAAEEYFLSRLFYRYSDWIVIDLNISTDKFWRSSE